MKYSVDFPDKLLGFHRFFCPARDTPQSSPHGGIPARPAEVAEPARAASIPLCPLDAKAVSAPAEAAPSDGVSCPETPAELTEAPVSGERSTLPAAVANCQPPPETFLAHTLPGRQRFAQEFLAGRVPGVQQSYAPDASFGGRAGWVESDETVARLMRWREDSAY